MSRILNLSNFPIDEKPSEAPKVFSPGIDLSSEVFIPRTCNVMAPVKKSLPKRIISIFMELGLMEALGEAAQSESQFVSRTATCLQQVGNWLKHYWQLYPLEQSLDLIARYSQTYDYKTSMVRCLAWHPQCSAIAVAALNDTVLIYAKLHQSSKSTTQLKNILQKDVTCLAWRPYTSGELAVGCRNGVFFWTVDRIRNFMKGPLSQAVHLKHGHHYPVTSMCWSKNGELLVTASINDTQLLVWNVDQQRCVPMYRFQLPCAQASFGPLGHNMIVSTVGKHFYICSAPPDRIQRVSWSTAKGWLQSFAWSRDEKHLLFVTSEDMLLFYMRHFGIKSTSTQVAVPLVELDPKPLSEYAKIGGKPQALAWCPRNRFLAITFKGTAEPIAIFFTDLSGPQISIDPYSVVTHPYQETVSCISFPENYEPEENGPVRSVLWVGWSGGSLEYYAL